MPPAPKRKRVVPPSSDDYSTEDGEEQAHRSTEICVDFIKKLCCTPGCKFRDFHNGPHSNDVSLGTRSRLPTTGAGNSPKSEITIDNRGLAGYGGLCKSGHRETFVQTCLATTGPVAYLEGPDGALTSLLLAKGVARDRLTPFNLSETVAKSIDCRFPGVKCQVQDICEAAAGADEEQFSSVWFDMCGVDFGVFEVDDLVHCAEYKLFTLSCRQLVCSDQQTVLCQRLSGAGEKIIERSLYTGCSGKAMNMVFIASKRSSHNNSKCILDESKATCNKMINVGTIVRFPLCHWKETEFVKAYGFKVFEQNFLMGAVHSPCSGSNSTYRLSFQLEGGGSMLCSSKYSRDCVLNHTI